MYHTPGGRTLVKTALIILWMRVHLTRLFPQSASVTLTGGIHQTASSCLKTAQAILCRIHFRRVVPKPFHETVPEADLFNDVCPGNVWNRGGCSMPTIWSDSS